MKSTLFGTIVSVMFISGCSYESTSDTSIVGGDVAEETSEEENAKLSLWSTVGFLMGGKLFCTGTLIDKNHIVSAAHCFDPKRPVSGLQIGFGTKPKPIQASNIKIFNHPKWKGQTNPYQDIALVVFDGQVPETNGPVDIATTEVTPQAKVIPAGYGQTGDNAGDYGTLHYVETTVYTVDQPNDEFSFTEGEKKGTCQGDSGGPTYLKKYVKEADNKGPVKEANENSTYPVYEVIGVTSRGGDCNPGNGINTDATKYKSWLKCVAAEKLKKPFVKQLEEDASKKDCNNLEGQVITPDGGPTQAQQQQPFAPQGEQPLLQQPGYGYNNG